MKKILSLKILLLVLFFGASLVWAEDRVVDVSVNVGDTILIVSGKAFPGAYITVTENEAVIGTVTADALGNFEKELFAQESGVRSIGLYGVDADNLTTSTSTHTLTLERGIDNILSNVILPPTISISGTEIAKGDTVDVFGYAPISSTVTVYVNDSLAGSTSSDAFGYYKYTYDTDTHTVGSSYRV
ncbi:hypothetical protein C4578_02620 [Candidatus Microgenomates bacterium]|nr:MAG: hypothetical protein C4578_02620 [Candidatus Microgenomates bacterium]